MRLLVVGAGPIGSLYAGRLALAGHEVELAARGERLGALRDSGLRLVDGATGREERAPLRVVEAGAPAAAYDAAIVAVRSERLAAALPALEALRGAACLVTMVNQPDGGAAAAARLGAERLVLGFPGATASIRPDGSVAYGVAPGFAQRTTFGDAAGGASPRCRCLAEACGAAGFPSALSADMPAWLRTHAAFIGPVGVALAFMAGSLEALASDRAAIALMVDGIREGLAALRASGSRIEPARLRALLAPRSLVLALASALLRSKSMAPVLGGHAAVSRDEMRELIGASLARAREAGMPRAALEGLLAALG